MNRRLRLILLGSLIGFIFSFLLSVTISSVIWFNNNPSLAEMRETFNTHTDLTDEELDRVMWVAMIGAIIDFILNVGLIVVPSVLVGMGLGAIGGYLWAVWDNHQLAAKQVTGILEITHEDRSS